MRVGGTQEKVQLCSPTGPGSALTSLSFFRVPPPWTPLPAWRLSWGGTDQCKGRGGEGRSGGGEVTPGEETTQVAPGELCGAGCWAPGERRLGTGSDRCPARTEGGGPQEDAGQGQEERAEFGESLLGPARPHLLGWGWSRLPRARSPRSGWPAGGGWSGRERTPHPDTRSSEAAWGLRAQMPAVGVALGFLGAAGRWGPEEAGWGLQRAPHTPAAATVGGSLARAVCESSG